MGKRLTAATLLLLLALSCGTTRKMHRIRQQSLSASLNLSQDVGATDIRIWATIRLAFAQYIAGDKMTATQMLLDQDAELPVEHLDGEKDKTAMAEAKVALANLFSEAGDRDGKSFFLTQAVDLFEEVGQADSAARYRAQL